MRRFAAVLCAMLLSACNGISVPAPSVQQNRMRGSWTLVDSLDGVELHRATLVIDTEDASSFSGSADVHFTSASGAMEQAIGTVDGTTSELGRISFRVKTAADTINYAGSLSTKTASGTWSASGKVGSFVMRNDGSDQGKGSGVQSRRAGAAQHMAP